MRFDILTLFPEMCRPVLEGSILGRAARAGTVAFGVHDIRDHGKGRHRVVDDTPYGGGSGMVMRVDVVDAALSEVRRPESRVLLMAPAGRPFTQADAVRLSRCPQLVLICGHYEGIDGRVAENLVDEVVSIGDYVLTGGELAALVVVDAVARQVPGVLGNPESLSEESFTNGLLEAPAYTRPPEYRGWVVPEVLRSGHHARIAAWRAAEGRALTERVRPELLGGSPSSRPSEEQPALDEGDGLE
jgi:tRNA (guanine37-N1)-methyltransferase